MDLASPRRGRWPPIAERDPVIGLERLCNQQLCLLGRRASRFWNPRRVGDARGFYSFTSPKASATPAFKSACGSTLPKISINFATTPVEEEVVAPVRIGLEFLGLAIHWPVPRLVVEENAGQSISDLAADLEEVHQVPRAGRTFDFERIAVIQIILQQGAHQQRVHRHPDRTTPIGVAAEHAGIRLRRKISHSVFLVCAKNTNGCSA